MPQSQLDLYNMAVASTGGDFTIATLVEESVPRELCDLYYETVYKTVLRAAHWKVAKRFARLVKVKERDFSQDWAADDPEPDWMFSYAMPSTALAARHLNDFSMFTVGWDETTSQDVLYANVGGPNANDAPILTFTADIGPDPVNWNPDLYLATAYGLASYISRPLNGKRAQAMEMLQIANDLILSARAHTANEQQVIQRVIPSELAARGFDAFPEFRFIQQYGPLLALPGTQPIGPK